MSVEPDIYPGLNDLSDTLEALPLEIVRSFTLLREIEAKCLQPSYALNQLITKFFQYPLEGTTIEVQKGRLKVLEDIRELIKELMPCQEEKMHVAGMAQDCLAKHIARIDYDYDLISNSEIPHDVVYGSLDHPAIISDVKMLNADQRAQASRSESRREAMAARKAAQQQQQQQQAGNSTPTTANADNISRKRTSTPVNGTSQKSLSSRQKAKPQPPTNTQPIITESSSKRRRVNNETEDYYKNALNNTIVPTANHAYTDSNVPSRSGTPIPTSRRTNRSNPRTKEIMPGNVADGTAPEPVYCYCQQVSYGEMVGCDGPDCKREWFHLSCIGLPSPPKGEWFCDECSGKYKKRR